MKSQFSIKPLFCMSCCCVDGESAGWLGASGGGSGGGCKNQAHDIFQVCFFPVFFPVFMCWSAIDVITLEGQSSERVPLYVCVCVCIPDGCWINCRFFCRKRARLIFFCFVLHATVDASRALISFFSVKGLGTWQAPRNYMHVLACGWRFSILFTMCSVLWDFPCLHESLAADVPLVVAAAVVFFFFFGY